MSSEPRVLVITLQRFGDVLLTTPLVRAIRQGMPGARIDMLVFSGTEGILAGNPDIESVIAIPRRPGAFKTASLIWRFWRRYDLAISTQSGDRPTLAAAIAGRRRVGFVPPGGARWKRLLMDRSIVADADAHRVVELFRLADSLGIYERPDVVAPARVPPLAARAPYAVLHASPLYQIRRWTDDGWRALARSLAQRHLAVVVTGGPGDGEREYLDRVWSPVHSLVERADGRMNWGELAQLLSGAAVYVGPDTSMTHLAASTGCPTVAIYGPASPRSMGPWPVGGLREPWAHVDTVQRRGNVWVVQNPLPCVPCDRLGCDNHLNSRSQCLDELSPVQVMRAVDEALGERSRSPATRRPVVENPANTVPPIYTKNIASA